MQEIGEKPKNLKELFWRLLLVAKSCSLLCFQRCPTTDIVFLT
jgi:hypothetical protein